LPANKRIVVFYTTSNHEYASVSNLEFNQIQAFKKMLKVINNFPDIYLVVRVHPNNNRKNNIDDKLWFQFNNCKKISVISSQDPIDTYALMRRADIVVTYSSTIALEASYFGKPSVVLKKFWWTKKTTLLIDNIRDLNKIFNKNYKFKKIKKKACLPVANYILNYGKKFRYYKQESFYKGKFLGQTLTWKSYLIRFLELFGLNFYYLFLKKKFLYYYNTYL
jgi:predicted glycosyltransferase